MPFPLPFCPNPSWLKELRKEMLTTVDGSVVNSNNNVNFNERNE